MSKSSVHGSSSDICWDLTENGELLVCLKGFLTSEREVKPAGARQVQLHGASKDFNVGGSSLNGLSAHLHPHSRHHHRVVIVHYFHRETSRLLAGNNTNDLKWKSKPLMIISK